MADFFDRLVAHAFGDAVVAIPEPRSPFEGPGLDSPLELELPGEPVRGAPLADERPRELLAPREEKEATNAAAHRVTGPGRSSIPNELAAPSFQETGEPIVAERGARAAEQPKPHAPPPIPGRVAIPAVASPAADDTVTPELTRSFAPIPVPGCAVPAQREFPATETASPSTAARPERVTAEPGPPASEPGQPGGFVTEEKVIRVSIGRVEIKAAAPPPAPRRERAGRPAPRVSLDSYLDRSGRRG